MQTDNNSNTMITVKMTETEYDAYQLYLKSIAIILESEKKTKAKNSLDEYLANTANINEIKAGFEDIKAGRISFVNPFDLWESIK